MPAAPTPAVEAGVGGSHQLPPNLFSRGILATSSEAAQANKEKSATCTNCKDKTTTPAAELTRSIRILLVLAASACACCMATWQHESRTSFIKVGKMISLHAQINKIKQVGQAAIAHTLDLTNTNHDGREPMDP